MQNACELKRSFWRRRKKQVIELHNKEKGTKNGRESERNTVNNKKKVESNGY